MGLIKFNTFLLATLLTTNSLTYCQQNTPLLLNDTGNIFHPVTVTKPLAKRYFDQGLAFIYAFNHDFAFASFKKAVDIDPDFAMGYWGMALSIGPNINSEMIQENGLKAYEYIQKALVLSKNISENERDYILALSKRYSNNPDTNRKDLDIAYRQAMKEVYKKYEEDLDAATLYCESVMDLTPWDLWTKKGDFKPGIDEIIVILEEVLKKDPDHLGANHFWVHVFEGSNQPQIALSSAYRLTKLYKESGHLLHMGAHIFLPCGFYQEAVLANLEAIKADNNYIKTYGKQGYPLHYMSHNMASLIRAYTLQGNYESAIKTSNELYDFVIKDVDEMPNLEKYTLQTIYTNLSFYKWDEVLKIEKPKDSLRFANAIWHFSKSYAWAFKKDIDKAKEEQVLFLEASKLVNGSEYYGYNLSLNILEICRLSLESKILEVSGDFIGARAKLEETIILQDNLSYNEPPDWFIPQRIPYAAFLIRQGNFKIAVTSLKEELIRHPRNGRALYALKYAYEKLSKQTDAQWVEQEFKSAWKYADTSLDLNEF